jgi:sortase A
MGRFLKKHFTTIVLLLIFLTGLCLLLYPTFSNWWNSFHQSRAIASYVEAVEDMSQAQREIMLAQAQEYNEGIASRGNAFVLTEEQEAAYRDILDVSGTGIMGYIHIPKIGVSLPIYHGTDETVLQVAVGHLSGTSLPVGGESTHTVLSGHRGLPSAKLFTDLDELTVGDTFTLTVLGQTLTYQVDQIRTVEPDDTSELKIESGKDYCTLVTCTPYGVNSHRLLVRGVRVDVAEELGTVASEAVKIPTYLVIPAVGVPLLLVLLALLLVVNRRKKPTMSYTDLLDALKQDEQ